ncbi:MAG: hypothetical protein IKA76_09315, partial [Clostridia bacterium]|nr:hypothetical protein [Clostridia bacterium]
MKARKWIVLLLSILMVLSLLASCASNEDGEGNETDAPETDAPETGSEDLLEQIAQKYKNQNSLRIEQTVTSRQTVDEVETETRITNTLTVNGLNRWRHLDKGLNGFSFSLECGLESRLLDSADASMTNEAITITLLDSVLYVQTMERYGTEVHQIYEKYPVQNKDEISDLFGTVVPLWEEPPYLSSLISYWNDTQVEIEGEGKKVSFSVGKSKKANDILNDIITSFAPINRDEADEGDVVEIIPFTDLSANGSFAFDTSFNIKRSSLDINGTLLMDEVTNPIPFNVQTDTRYFYGKDVDKVILPEQADQYVDPFEQKIASEGTRWAVLKKQEIPNLSDPNAESFSSSGSVPEDKITHFVELLNRQNWTRTKESGSGNYIFYGWVSDEIVTNPSLQYATMVHNVRYDDEKGVLYHAIDSVLNGRRKATLSAEDKAWLDDLLSSLEYHDVGYVPAPPEEESDLSRVSHWSLCAFEEYGEETERWRTREIASTDQTVLQNLFESLVWESGTHEPNEVFVGFDGLSNDVPIMRIYYDSENGILMEGDLYTKIARLSEEQQEVLETVIQHVFSISNLDPNEIVQGRVWPNEEHASVNYLTDAQLQSLKTLAWESFPVEFGRYSPEKTTFEIVLEGADWETLLQILYDWEEGIIYSEWDPCYYRVPESARAVLNAMIEEQYPKTNFPSDGEWVLGAVFDDLTNEAPLEREELDGLLEILNRLQWTETDKIPQKRDYFMRAERTHGENYNSTLRSFSLIYDEVEGALFHPVYSLRANLTEEERAYIDALMASHNVKIWEVCARHDVSDLFSYYLDTMTKEDSDALWALKERLTWTEYTEEWNRTQWFFKLLNHYGVTIELDYDRENGRLVYPRKKLAADLGEADVALIERLITTYFPLPSFDLALPFDIQINGIGTCKLSKEKSDALAALLNGLPWDGISVRPDGDGALWIWYETEEQRFVNEVYYYPSVNLLYSLETGRSSEVPEDLRELLDTVIAEHVLRTDFSRYEEISARWQRYYGAPMNADQAEWLANLLNRLQWTEIEYTRDYEAPYFEIRFSCENEKFHYERIVYDRSNGTLTNEAHDLRATLSAQEIVFIEAFMEQYETGTAPELGEHEHWFGSWQQTEAPTCVEAGEEIRQCVVCPETETRPVAATGVHTTDVDKNHKCDECGAPVGTHADSDNDGDHECDYCGSVMNDCDDADRDHACDECGITMGIHADKSNDGNHKCDYCDEPMTVCDDTDKDHDCDECGTPVSVCDDADKDHDCDICGVNMGTHADSDNDGDHECDYCGSVMNDCDDADKDHACDECGVSIGMHADAEHDGDHKCEYCGKVMTACVDGDKDHECDECGLSKGTHADSDNDGDHECDYCNAVMTDCDDADKDHACDECGVSIGMHADAEHDGDHKCEYCGKVM